MLTCLLASSLALLPVLTGASATGANDSEPAPARDERGTRRAPSDRGVGLSEDAATPFASLDSGGHAALERGLAFLATQQATAIDGSFPGGQRENDARLGVTALGALAYMAGGSTPGRGPHGQEVARAIDYLLSRVRPPDHEHAGYIADEADLRSQTHGHGLATLALAQAYSTSPHTPRGRRTGEALRAAVRRIEESQGLEGGWHYYPYRSVEHEGSVTVCHVQGLRAARNVGVHVDTKVIAKAIDYVKRLQDDNGGFRYALHEPRTSVALTGACLATLQATGIYDGAPIDEGYGYVWRELAAREIARERGSHKLRPGHPYYERFYLSQALWQHRQTEVYADWAEKETQGVLTTQHPNGSWDHELYGSSYATAMNCLFLALPDGLLPIFQR